MRCTVLYMRFNRNLAQVLLVEDQNAIMIDTEGLSIPLKVPYRRIHSHILLELVASEIPIEVPRRQGRRSLPAKRHTGDLTPHPGVTKHGGAADPQLEVHPIVRELVNGVLDRVLVAAPEIQQVG